MFEPQTQPALQSPRDRFAETPFLVIWETTQACDLACQHCRACAQPKRDPQELDTAQALDLIRQVDEWGVPLFVLTGGDPLKRPDLMELIAECSRRRMTFALAPSVTPLVTQEKLKRLKDAGLHRISISLDGADAATHDAFRGVPGSFRDTLAVLRLIREAGIELQVNTSVGKQNAGQLHRIVDLIRPLGIELWSVFFVVPTGRATRDQMLNAPQVESALGFLYAQLEKGEFDIKTTEAPHFRRVILQKNGVKPEDLGEALKTHPKPGLLRSARGVNDGRGFVFVSHKGEVFPSGFLPVSGGRMGEKALREIYRESETFKTLRDSDQLKGKCGGCEYRYICGGSRARAYGMSGDLMAIDPLCAYQPPSRVG